MTTVWIQTINDICVDALEHCGKLAAGESPSGEDFDVCTRALDGILKELPIHGLSWPQMTSARVALTWDLASPGTVVLPADYLGVPTLWGTTPAGPVKQLRRVDKPTFDRLPSGASGMPEVYFVRPDLQINLHPVPEADPGLSLSYQAIVPDTENGEPPQLPQVWTLGMGWWVASEVMGKYLVPMAERQYIEAKFQQRKALMLGYAAEDTPVDMTVDDGSYWPRGPLCL
jgi:hypothetical protein